MDTTKITKGDTVRVAEGKHAGRTGVISMVQGWRSWVWLCKPDGTSEQAMVPVKNLHREEEAR